MIETPKSKPKGLHRASVSWHWPRPSSFYAFPEFRATPESKCRKSSTPGGIRTPNPRFRRPSSGMPDIPRQNRPRHARPRQERGSTYSGSGPRNDMVRHSTTFPDSPTESMTKSMLPPVANVETSGESSIHEFSAPVTCARWPESCPIVRHSPEQLFIRTGATDILATVSRTLESQWLEIAASAPEKTDRMGGWMSCDCKRSVTS